MKKIIKIFNNFLLKAAKYILLKNNKAWQTQMIHLNRKRKFNFFPGSEYVRTSTLELISDEIYSNNIEGNVAELGVYQGDFAKWINLAFPDRKLYLFDTFKGFNNKELEKDIQNKYTGYRQDFSNTSVEVVINKMKYKDNVKIKMGFFPESIGDLQEKYCFVSLDADLYDPTYDGLKYFFNNLNYGGYIMVHDFNNDKYRGVKEAVKKFCEKRYISYFPLTDRGGSVIIKKAGIDDNP